MYLRRCSSLARPRRCLLTRWQRPRAVPPSLTRRAWLTAAAVTPPGSGSDNGDDGGTTSPQIGSPFNIPNALTFSRILGTPVVIHWINDGRYNLVLGSFAVFAATDYLDGYLARSWKQITAIGSFMDPLADKILVNGMAVPLAMQGLVPWPLVGLIIGRDVAIIAGVMYSRALTIAPPFTWAKYTSVSSATPQNLKPTNISKVNTVLQCITIITAVARAAEVLPGMELVSPDTTELAWQALIWSTGITTAWSWADYFNHFINGNRNWQKSLAQPSDAAATAARRLVNGGGGRSSSGPAAKVGARPSK